MPPERADPWTPPRIHDPEPGPPAPPAPPSPRRAVVASIALLVFAGVQAGGVLLLDVIPDVAHQLFVERQSLYDPEDNTIVFAFVWLAELVAVPLVLVAWLAWLRVVLPGAGVIRDHLVPGLNVLASLRVLLRAAGTWPLGRSLAVGIWALTTAALVALGSIPLAAGAWRGHCAAAGIGSYRGRDWCTFVRDAWHHEVALCLLALAALLAATFVLGVERRRRRTATWPPDQASRPTS